MPPNFFTINVENHAVASRTDRQPVPAVVKRCHIEASVLEARAANVVVRAEARLIWVQDDLVVASRAAGEGVPGTGARDRGLEVAVDGPRAVGVNTAVAEACRVAAAAEEHAVLVAGRSFDDARAAGDGAGVACGAAKGDFTIDDIERNHQLRRCSGLRQLVGRVSAIVDPEAVHVAPLLVATLVVADGEELPSTQTRQSVAHGVEYVEPWCGLAR